MLNFMSVVMDESCKHTVEQDKGHRIQSVTMFEGFKFFELGLCTEFNSPECEILNRPKAESPFSLD